MKKQADDSVIKVFIGSQIKQYREGLGLTQQELAEKVFLTRSAIVNIETGRCGSTLGKLYKIAEVLNIQINNILPSDSWVKDHEGKKVVRKYYLEIE